MKNTLYTLQGIAILVSFLFLSSCFPVNSSEQPKALLVPQQSLEQKAEEQKAAYAANITALLQADHDISGSGDYTEYSTAMRKLNLSGCPTDFAAAYVDHIHAWEEAGLIQRAQKQLNSDENIKATIVASVLADLLGADAAPIHDAAEAEAELKKGMENALLKVRETFNKVEHLAANYGATLPH